MLIKTNSLKFFFGNFGQGLIWNYVSFGFMAVVGLLLNLFIGSHYGSSVLGGFWQIYAIYIVVSHLAVGGLYFSVLHFLPIQEKACHNSLLNAALILAGVLSLFVAFLLFVSAESIGDLVDSWFVASGCIIIVPGIFFSAQNKIMLSFLNGSGLLVDYAFVQMLRSISMGVILFLAATYSVSPELLPLILVGSEGVVFVYFVCLYIRKKLYICNRRELVEWMFKNISYASRGFLIPFLYDLNTKVDILVLGYFMNDSAVGAYSFAAMLFEGLQQIPTVVQTSLNPRLALCYHQQNFSHIKRYFNNSFRYLTPVFILILGLVMLLFDYGLALLSMNEGYALSKEVLMILLTGLICVGGSIPISMILNQAGFPGCYTLQLFIAVALNLILNILLIPDYGIIGAALATVISMLLGFVLFIIFSQLLLKINFINLRFKK